MWKARTLREVVRRSAEIVTRIYGCGVVFNLEETAVHFAAFNFVNPRADVRTGAIDLDVRSRRSIDLIQESAHKLPSPSPKRENKTQAGFTQTRRKLKSRLSLIFEHPERCCREIQSLYYFHCFFRICCICIIKLMCENTLNK